MLISVIMIDGGFRENLFGAEYFCKQSFKDEEYEVIWVEFYEKVPDKVRDQKKIKVITLNNPSELIYHSSYCFNKGITEAQGELIVIPDADQIVEPDFLTKLWNLHSVNDRLVVYPYRLDEISSGALVSYDFSELKEKCVLKNSSNYGGCLSVRKKWLLEINGYEQHKIFESGFHANGLDIYTRLRNLGLAIMWAPDIHMFHPWHPFTLTQADQYKVQRALIDWRLKNLQVLAFSGIDHARNFLGFDINEFEEEMKKSNSKPSRSARGIRKKLKRFLKKYFY